MAKRLDTIGGVPVYRDADGSVFFTAGMTIDADGAPRAYGPAPLRGLDALANAGGPGNWYGVVTANGSPTGRPVVQGPRDPAPGFYVSSTSLQDPDRARTDPRRYVDSDTVPFIVLPGGHYPAWGIALGDLALVTRLNGQRQCFAVFADIGPRTKIGEGSIALARTLGIPSDPRTGGASAGVFYRVFPGSRGKWPMTPAQIAVAGLAASVHREAA